jgi:uncharacterized protein YdeI (YjbR/CyaY-like superfamily)
MINMKTEVAELHFSARNDFRMWLQENAETSGGVWLVFGKTKSVQTLSANDALEEALCFGWIDGQMKSIDEHQYVKYFARRQEKSHWSEKNKTIVEKLRAKSLMTELGEKAVNAAVKNGEWNAAKSEVIGGEQVAAFAKKLIDFLQSNSSSGEASPAYENFMNMPPSIQKTYTKRYLSFKSEESREKDFLKIVERLSQNLKPM